MRKLVLMLVGTQSTNFKGNESNGKGYLKLMYLGAERKVTESQFPIPTNPVSIIHVFRS
jgi:hypothetical protein